MSSIISKKNWAYWLLLTLAFVLLFLFFKSKARTQRLDQQLQEPLGLLTWITKKPKS